MKRILVVEDDRDIGTLVKYNLQADGFDVTLVADGRPALCELQRGAFDLMLLDLMLPTVSGLEVCKAVRSNPTLQQLPILIMTARGEVAVRSLAFSMGANDYLVKPFSPCELAARVRALLALSQSSEAVQASSIQQLSSDHRISERAYKPESPTVRLFSATYAESTSSRRQWRQSYQP